MKKLLLTGIAALLMATSVHASYKPTCAAVLRDAIDVHLKPNAKSEILTTVFGSDVLVLDADPTMDLYKDWSYVYGMIVEDGKESLGPRGLIGGKPAQRK